MREKIKEDISNMISDLITAEYGFEYINETAEEIIDKVEEALFPKWISVEERLPEEDVTVVVTISGCNFVMKYAHGHFWNWDAKVYTGRITHWMPLPELPKGEE